MHTVAYHYQHQVKVCHNNSPYLCTLFWLISSVAIIVLHSIHLVLDCDTNKTNLNEPTEKNQRGLALIVIGIVLADIIDYLLNQMGMMVVAVTMVFVMMASHFGFTVPS